MSSLLQLVYRDAANLYQDVQRRIEQGADLDALTEYGESALRVASNHGRFDVVGLLLAAGADRTQLGWSELIGQVALGSLAEVSAAAEHADLEARDFWSRTAFLVAVQAGDIAKAALLLELGADRHAVGRCGKTSMQYAVQHNDLPMLAWLREQGFDIEAVDDFLGTALLEAAERGHADCVRFLVDAGADIYRGNHIPERAIEVAASMAVVDILVAQGDDINAISPEMRAELLGVEHAGAPQTTELAYLAGKRRVFGRANPDESLNPFCLAMILSGASAYQARSMFKESASAMREPVWSYQRFGRSTTVMGDGRIIEIGGEHEDHYDPDFCIYNDVTLFEDASIRQFGYPEDVFPPTDFHTATLVGEAILIIGAVGDPARREHGNTPLYRLDTRSMRMEKLAAHGDQPGWISRHKALLRDPGTIVIHGGKVMVKTEGGEDYVDNDQRFALDLKTLTWTRIAETAN